MDEKRCSKCKATKPVNQFSKNCRTKDGLTAWCKQCISVAAKAKRKSHPELMREQGRRSKLKHRFNMTPQQWDALYASQGGLCAICGRKSNRSRMHTDHDHSCCPGERSCGKCVRGLLCRDCNYKLLGHICREGTQGKAHAIDVLKRAIAYLERVASDHSHTITSSHE